MRSTVGYGKTAVTWGLLCVVALLGALALQRQRVAWAGLAALVVLIAIVPALRNRQLSMVPPWPLVVIAGVPIAVRVLTLTDLQNPNGLPTLPALPTQWLATAGTFADAAALAAIALLAVAVLQQFSDLRMTTRFGSFFVVVTTVGLAGFWAIARWAGTLYLDLPTEFVATNAALMLELGVTTLAGLLVAVLFGPYFCRARPKRGESV